MEHFELSRQIALKIRARLRQLRINQTDLAKMMDANPTEVSKWCSGYHNFTIKTLDRIQVILGISFFNFDSQKTIQISCLPCEFSGLIKK